MRPARTRREPLAAPDRLLTVTQLRAAAGLGVLSTHDMRLSGIYDSALAWVEGHLDMPAPLGSWTSSYPFWARYSGGRQDGHGYRYLRPRLELGGRADPGSVAVKYTDAANAAQTLAADKWLLDDSDDPPAVVLKEGTDRPVLSTDVRYPVSVTYESGPALYNGTNAVREAVRLLVGDMFRSGAGDEPSEAVVMRLTTMLAPWVYSAGI